VKHLLTTAKWLCQRGELPLAALRIEEARASRGGWGASRRCREALRRHLAGSQRARSISSWKLLSARANSFGQCPGRAFDCLQSCSRPDPMARSLSPTHL